MVGKEEVQIPQAQPQQPGQVPISSDEIYANGMQEERVRNLISQTSPDKMLVDLQWRIRGYMRDPISQGFIKSDPNTPEPSPVLISKFISYCSSVISDNTRMSNLSAQEINKIMKLVIEWTVDELDGNAEEYGLVDNYTERTRIGHIILNSTFLALKRALNGLESKRIYNAVQISDDMGGGAGGGAKKKAMDALKFWK